MNSRLKLYRHDEKNEDGMKDDSITINERCKLSKEKDRLILQLETELAQLSKVSTTLIPIYIYIYIFYLFCFVLFCFVLFCFVLQVT